MKKKLGKLFSTLFYKQIRIPIIKYAKFSVLLGTTVKNVRFVFNKYYNIDIHIMLT